MESLHRLEVFPLVTADAAERLALAERLAARGLSVGFREMIGGRVLEIGWKNGRVSRRWLDGNVDAEAGAEAEAVREAASRPLSLTALPECLIYDLYLPGFRGNHVVQLAGSGDGCWTATSLRSGIAWVETTLTGLQNEPDGWVRQQYGVSKAQLLGEWASLLEKMRACREHRLIFRPADCLHRPDEERLAA